MSTTTSNFGLFKYDTTADAQTAFSIDTALNNNWDVLDTNCVKRLSTSAATGSSTQPVYVDGTGKIQACNAYSTIPSGLTATTSLSENGYIKFSNSFLMNYGQASVSSQETTWTYSALTQNGTMGGNSCACTAGSTYTGAPWQVFDKNTTTSSNWYSAAIGAPDYITFYSPTPIKLVTATMYNAVNTLASQVFTQGSNDNSTWHTVAPQITVPPQSSGTGIAYGSSTDHYKYLKFTISPSSGNRAAMGEITINATYTTTAISSVTFATAHTSGNYAYSLAYLAGAQGNSFANNRTLTGFNLQNNSNATKVFYMTMGY